MQANGDTDSVWYSITHSGWVAALLATTWGIILRALIGRYGELQKQAREDREAIRDALEENRQAIATLANDNRVAIAALASRIALLEDHDTWRRRPS